MFEFLTRDRGILGAVESTELCGPTNKWYFISRLIYFNINLYCKCSSIVNYVLPTTWKNNDFFKNLRRVVYFDCRGSEALDFLLHIFCLSNHFSLSLSNNLYLPLCPYFNQCPLNLYLSQADRETGIGLVESRFCKCGTITCICHLHTQCSNCNLIPLLL